MAGREGLRRRHMKDSRDVHDDDDLLDTDAYRPDMDELQKEKEKGHLLLVVQSFLARYCSDLRRSILSWLRRRPHAEGSAPVQEPTSETLAALAMLQSMQGLAMDPEIKVAQEDNLQAVWELLCPDRPFERLSKQWSDGTLGLRNMLHLATYHTARCRDMLARPHNGFPWALAAINISAYVTSLVINNPGKVGNALFGDMVDSEDVLRTFDELFGLVFLEFEEFYTVCIGAFLKDGGNPAFAIMEFNSIRKRFFDELTKQVTGGKFDEVFINRTLQNRANAQDSWPTYARSRYQDDGDETNGVTRVQASAAPVASPRKTSEHENDLISFE